MIDADIIQSKLNTGKIIWLDKVDSTNTYIKNNDLNHGDIVITTNQTAGKGRLGRQWDSKDGIAMSLCIVPEKNVSNIPMISLVMGAAVCVAVRKICGINCMIKWPNDIVVNGKKLCGILTEAVTQYNSITKIVCGIGINVTNESFDGELIEKATSLKLETGIECDINNLIVEIVNTFFLFGYKLPECFKDMCVTIGKEVTVISPNNIFDGKAVDVDEKGELIVETRDGQRVNVSSGEVSVRGIYGYV